VTSIRRFCDDCVTRAEFGLDAAIQVFGGPGVFFGLRVIPRRRQMNLLNPE